MHLLPKDWLLHVSLRQGGLRLPSACSPFMVVVRPPVGVVTVPSGPGSCWGSTRLWRCWQTWSSWLHKTSVPQVMAKPYMGREVLAPRTNSTAHGSHVWPIQNETHCTELYVGWLKLCFPHYKRKVCPQSGSLTGWHLVITLIHLEINLRSEFPWPVRRNMSWPNPASSPSSWERAPGPGQPPRPGREFLVMRGSCLAGVPHWERFWNALPEHRSQTS